MSDQISIAIHGYGTYAILYRHLIEHAKTTAPDIAWAIMLPTSHHQDAIAEVLPPDRICCLEDEQGGKNGEVDPAQLENYRGNIYADIETEKKVFKFRPGADQVSRASEIYSIYRAFLQRIRPTHLLFAHVETFDGKVLFAIAKELNINTVLPVDLRHFGGTAFCETTDEVLPDYRTANPAFASRAANFMNEYRQQPKPSSRLSMFALPSGDDPLSVYTKPFAKRVLNFAIRTIRNPRLFEAALFLTSLKYAFPGIREFLRRRRASRNVRQFDLNAIEQLPGKFIYYPLQTTPESSINTPAPYYIDQFRAIDAIRFAMPSDYTLIVKEHWASLDIRPSVFYKRLRQKAGVQIAYSGMSSIELIKRAQLTMSVTGSATLEAFLLGKPSLVLGGCFAASYLGGICTLGVMADRIKAAIANPPKDNAVLAALMEIYDVRYECVVRPADEPGHYGIRPENIRRLLAAIIDHIARSRRLTGPNDSAVTGTISANMAGMPS